MEGDTLHCSIVDSRLVPEPGTWGVKEANVEGRKSEPPEIVAARAREIFASSSDSIRSELDHARGWLSGISRTNTPAFWEADAAAGAIGALANAWGRLTLWARATDRHDQVRDELDRAMQQLVELRQHLVQATPAPDFFPRLESLLETIEGIERTLASEGV